MGHNLRRGGARPAKVALAEAFSDGKVLDVPGRPRVVHTPGQTPAHCALLLEDRGALLAGDALCNHELMTRGGGPSVMPALLNVDDRAALESLAALERLDTETVLFGHGDPWRESSAAAVARARARAQAVAGRASARRPAPSLDSQTAADDRPAAPGTAAFRGAHDRSDDLEVVV